MTSRGYWYKNQTEIIMLGEKTRSRLFSLEVRIDHNSHEDSASCIFGARYHRTISTDPGVTKALLALFGHNKNTYRYLKLSVNKYNESTLHVTEAFIVPKEKVEIHPLISERIPGTALHFDMNKFSFYGHSVEQGRIQRRGVSSDTITEVLRFYNLPGTTNRISIQNIPEEPIIYFNYTLEG